MLWLQDNHSDMSLQLVKKEMLLENMG